MTLRVRDLMRTNLITCPPGAHLPAAAALLARHQIHAIVVADPSGMQQGVVSDMDLLAGEWLAGDSASQRALTAEQIMSAPVATIEADAPAVEAAARMQTERLHRLVVTEHERGIGVLSVSDLVRGLIAHMPGQQTVGAVMARGLVVCRANTSVSDAARAMTERHSRSLVVVDRRGQPQGVVTGVDLLPYLAGGDVTTTVDLLMHAPLTIGPAATLREAADRMLQLHVHRLLVVDPDQPEGMPLGIISTADLIREMAGAPS